MSEVRSILATELHQLADDFAIQAAQLAAGSEDAAEQALSSCERLGQVAQMIDAPALQEVALFLLSNIPELAMGAGGNGAHDCNAPAQLCYLLENCFQDGIDSSQWSALASELAANHWPLPMEAETATEIAAGLQQLAQPSAETATDIPQISADALTYLPASDVDANTLQAFYQETPLQAAQLGNLLSQLRHQVLNAAGSSETSFDSSLLQQAPRLIHTIKGSASLVGLSAISYLSHALEHYLQLITDVQDITLAKVELLLEANDAIELLIEHATSNPTAPLPDVLRVIDALYGQPPDVPLSASDALATSSEQSITPSLARTAAAVSTNVTSTHSEPPLTAESAAAPTPILNVPITVIDDNMRRADEINIVVGQLTTQLQGSMDCAERLAQQLQRVQAQVYELETMVDTQGVRASRDGDIIASKLSNTAALQTDFDPLEMDEYTALHSLGRAFSESTLDSRELSRELTDELSKLKNVLSQQTRLCRDLSHSIMSARMVPVESIAPRLERIVRQTARHTGRDVQLNIQGRDLAIDTDILQGLVEPLMHALRNAIDHGIELPDQRIAAGKPEQGTIWLQFRRDGNRIEVNCRDDGQGLNLDAIARRAVALGWSHSESQLSKSELVQLIFQPGFSTKSEVTAISGRGVGMDVVRASVERLKGTVSIDSERGSGCTLTFKLPLSLTAVHALFVRVGNDVYGLPSTMIEQVLYSDAGRVMRVGDRYVFEYGNQVAPVHTLASLLRERSTPLSELEQRPLPLVLVKSDLGLAALVVDQALDSRQIVIKGLSALLPPTPGIAGATVMPDGGIGVVLELRELLRASTAAATTYGAPQRTIPRNVQPVHAANVLVVDDSLSARRTLAQLLSDTGYAATTAIDGLDAITKLEQQHFDLFILDLEMPRMNGLELTTHLRGLPQYRDVPIVMITSRAADKHRQQALRTGVSVYLTKPYIDHDLLDQIDDLLPNDNRRSAKFSQYAMSKLSAAQ